MSHLYPIFLDLRRSAVLLVGGGGLAAQKLRTLEPTGADVTLVATRVAPACRRWTGAGTLRIEERAYRPGDLEGMRLVFAATDDAPLNHAIVAAARARGIVANAVDDPAHCDFHTPSVIRQGPFTLALSSAGAFPGLTKALREALEGWLPERDAAAVADLVAARRELRARPIPPAQRSAALRALAAGFRHRYLGAAPPLPERLPHEQRAEG